MNFFLVGGAVRDNLLNYPSHERDWVVVGATAEQMKALGYRAVGKDFPVFLHPQTQEEYALARTERKSGTGYTGFECFSSPNVSLEEDLERRDLTINAMAQAEDGGLIDPYGGQKDLENKILRHVSDAFAEDPLRVLRVARFAARYHHLGFRIAKSTLVLMKNLSDSGELAHLVAERVWKETEQALSEQSPWVYFQTLRECNGLKVLFPELDCLFGIPQTKKHHPEIDTGVHTMMALEQAAKLSSSPKIRFAVLLHDLGKGITPKEELPSHKGHEKYGVPLIRKVCERWKVPKRFLDLAIKAGEYHLLCHRAFTLRAETVVKMLGYLDALRKPEQFEDFLLACEADARGRKGREDKPYAQARFLKQALLATASVDTTPLLQQGLSGQKMGNAVKKLHIKAIKSLIQQTNTNNG